MDERCPGGDVIRPMEWARCVVIDRAGTRAHLACLEDPTRCLVRAEERFLLARRTCSAQWLRPGARFVHLVDDLAIVAVAGDVVAQVALLTTAGQLLPAPGGPPRSPGSPPGCRRRSTAASVSSIGTRTPGR